jgi:hypothetical protein
LDLSQPIASLLSDFNDGTASGPRTRDNPRISGALFRPQDLSFRKMAGLDGRSTAVIVAFSATATIFIHGLIVIVSESLSHSTYACKMDWRRTAGRAEH